MHKNEWKQVDEACGVHGAPSRGKQKQSHQELKQKGAESWINNSCKPPKSGESYEHRVSKKSNPASPRHAIIRLLRTNSRKKMLKAKKEEVHHIKGNYCKTTSRFLSETTQAGQFKWYKVLKEKEWQRMFNPVNLYFGNARWIRTFPDIQNHPDLSHIKCWTEYFKGDRRVSVNMKTYKSINSPVKWHTVKSRKF